MNNLRSDQNEQKIVVEIKVPIGDHWFYIGPKVDSSDQVREELQSLRVDVYFFKKKPCFESVSGFVKQKRKLSHVIMERRSVC